MECGAYLSFIVKVKKDSYCVTDQNGKKGLLLWDGRSINLRDMNERLFSSNSLEDEITGRFESFDLKYLSS